MTNNNYNFLAHMPFTRSVLCFVLLLLHVASAQQTCEPGWDCWVQSQTILINDYTITLNQSTLVIKQATCTNISIGQTKSSIPATNAILVNFDNTELNCVADWTYTTSSNGINSGTLAVIATGIDVTVDITTITDPTNYGLVKDVQTSCDMQVPPISIIFYNNTNTIPLSFQTELQEYFNTQIADVGCSQVENQTTSGLFTFFNGGAQWAADTISYIQPPQPPMAPPSTNNSVNFTNNPYLGLVNYVVNDVLSPNGSLSINTVVNSLTNNTGSFAYDLSGLANVSAIFQPGGFLEPVLVFGSFAQLSYTLQKINVTGLNTWELIDFGEAINSNTLATKTVLNNLVIELELLMNVTFLDPAAQGGSIVQPAVFRTTLTDNTLLTDATLTLSTDILSLLFPSQFLQPGCIGQSLVYLNINDLNMTFDMEDSTISGQADQITTSNQALMDTMFSSFLQSFEPVGDLIMYSFLWAVPGFMMQGNMAWGSLLNKTLSEVPCPGPTFDGETVNRVATLYAYVGAIAVFFLIVLLSYIVIRLREADEYEDTPIGETYKLNSEGASESAPLLRQYKTHALLHNSAIPFVIRYGVVFLILGNAALFVASNSSLGASVYLVARTSEGSTTFPSLFNFSLINSIRDMWNAKVYALSILIALFSGVWPYTKLFLLFFCWCSSVKILNIQRRGRILIMLDAMGKWSLIDSFVLILMMVAFHFKLAPPVTEFTPAGSISFEAYVEPHFGFYSFLIATMLSLVLTHLVIKLHDISLVDVEKENRMDNTREALWTHAAGQGNKNRAAYILAIVVGLLVTSSVLIVLGITIQSFEFDFRGAFGVLLKFLDEKQSLTFSVISLGQQFPGSSIDPDNIGTRFIQVSFFIFAIAMPIMYLVCLLILWMVPLTYRFQSRLLTLTATIHAWSALEVFVISIIAALLELQQFAQFIVGDRCDVINKLLTTYASELLHGDNKCFDVKASLRTGCWVLFAACAIYVVVGGLVVKGCHNALKKRLDSKPIGYVN